MIHSYVWRDVTHSCAWHDSCSGWRQGAKTYSYKLCRTKHSFPRRLVAPGISMCDMTRIFNLSIYLYVTWLINSLSKCDVTHTTFLDSTSDGARYIYVGHHSVTLRYISVWHDSYKISFLDVWWRQVYLCVTWLIQHSICVCMCDMTHTSFPRRLVAPGISMCDMTRTLYLSIYLYVRWLLNSVSICDMTHTTSRLSTSDGARYIYVWHGSYSILSIYLC